MTQKLPRNYCVNKNQLHFLNTNLQELTKMYGSPLRIHIPETLSENYAFIKEIVGQQLEQNGIAADRFQCGYAMKANQHQRLVSQAVEHVDFMEASSYNDLCILEHTLAQQKSKKILCHGFKIPQTTYYKKIVSLVQSGYNIVPIVDSISELIGFYHCSSIFNIGIRLTSQTKINELHISERFGVTLTELRQNINLLTEGKQLNLTTVHTHVANTITDIDQRLDDLTNLFSGYTYLQNQNLLVEYINIGGGLPSRAHTEDSFYVAFYQKIIHTLLCLHTKNTILPILQTESGRFLSEESELLVLKILTEKNTNDDFSWYILNGSAINLLPEMHLDATKIFSIIPTDGLSTTLKKRVWCAGITCDPEDYFSKKPIELPELSAFSQNLAIPNVGAYQESLQAAVRGYPGHCLIDAPKEITIDSDGIHVHEVSPDILTTLGYIT